MRFSDIFSLASRSVSANRLRTGLTVTIIALGIMALVGILTAIDSIKGSIYTSFASMGANSFAIRSRDLQVNMGGGGGGEATKGNNRTTRRKVKASNKNKPIAFADAREFKERFDFPAKVSVSYQGTGIATVYRGEKKTNPNVQVIGGDENYLAISNYTLDQGRDLNEADITTGRNVAVLGTDVAKKLFGQNMKNVLNSTVRVGNVRYRVIGVLASKGSSSMMSADNVVITSVNNTRRIFSKPNPTYQLSVAVKDVSQMEAAVGEATGLFRIIRHLNLNEEDNFTVSKSDSIAEMLFNNLRYVTTAAFIIGIITLLGSAIGLMNIMLVSVAERTREIGVTKALGATGQVIRRQFVYEAIIISVTGGVLGVFLGMIIGNLVSVLLSSPFIVPWLWIFMGIILCAGVGLVSGIYPAVKASKLDPIVALRYE
ncbi:ABC transporter permease [Chitinophaga pendula]|uniref:ABC transporter permease n=1 Tax=Chitinophaga TaxID=79328 RepID=UPI000BAEF57A|nr:MULTISPECIES: ABC transporter permease [Chitinophaga]ASZ14740.1 hypothetical protein CK934_29235 [Chitinophaga sp. MD30]UCJ07601.1 ABC transporter permease [Chitinophaga pendula]